METLPEKKIEKAGRLGANLAADDDAVPHAVDDHPDQPANDLRNAEIPGGSVSMPEVSIQKTDRLGGNAAAADAIPGSPDNSEQATSDLRKVETQSGSVPLPETNIRKSGRLGTDAAAADIILRSSDEDPDQVASDLRIAEDYAGATGRPAPPLELVKQHRESFRQATQEARNAEILSTSPILAALLRTPGNAALASDDVEALGYFEWVSKVTVTQVPLVKEGPPAPPEKTVREVLAEDIAGARGKGKEEVAALIDRILKQPELDSNGWIPVLHDVVAGKHTREEALRQLNAQLTPAGIATNEAVKGFLGEVTSKVGMTIEGTGAVIRPLVPHYDPTARNSMVLAIAAINPKTWAPDEIEAVRQKLYEQSALDHEEGKTYIDGIVSGELTPEQILSSRKQAQANFLERAVDAIQDTGASLSDNSEVYFAARPGMEESWARQAGKALGSAAPAFAVALLSRDKVTKYYTALESAGEAARDARKAGQDRTEQSIAGYLALPAGYLSGLKAERFVPIGTAQRLGVNLPKSGVGKFLTDVAIEGAGAAVQSTIKQAAQNAIAKYLYAPDKSLFDKIPSSGATDGAANMALKATELVVRKMLRGRMPSTGAKAAVGRQMVSVAEISVRAQASKLRQRDPEKFGEFVAQVTRNSPAANIYVPADQFVDYLRKQGIEPHSEIDHLGWISRGDLDAAIAAGGDLRIPTATYAAKIAGSEHDAFFTENARLHPADVSAKQAADPERREEGAQKDAEDARVDQEAREAVEGTAKDAETARVNRGTRRFMKKVPGDGEAVNVTEARRAVEGVDSDAGIAPVKGKATRKGTKTSGNAASVDANEQARRAVEGLDKDAEVARVKRKARRIQKDAP